jgi:magnesium transporter
VERLADEVEALEEHVLEPLDEARIFRIYELRRGTADVAAGCGTGG